MRKLLMILVAVCALHPSIAFSQCTGTIQGRVQDESDNPVAGAKIRYVEQSPVRVSKRYAESKTDGSFELPVEFTSPGALTIYAEKKEDGYPDQRIALFDERDPIEVKMNCGDTISNIVLQVGPKVGYIRKILVVDADTGEPLAASLTLKRVVSVLKGYTSDMLFIRAGADSTEIEIPSGADISYEISFKGYEPAKGILRVKPLEEVEISAKLNRKPLQ